MPSFNKSYFWSYDTKNISENLIIEQVLKYGDISEIKKVINKFGKDVCFKIWINKIIADSRFIRLNYFLARFIFNISTDKKEIFDYLVKHKRTRFEKSN